MPEVTASCGRNYAAFQVAERGQQGVSERYRDSEEAAPEAPSSRR